MASDWLCPAGSDLSPREREVLHALAEGTTQREIAYDLFISQATVKVHVRHIHSRREARNTAHAIAMAYERGLLPNRVGAGVAEAA